MKLLALDQSSNITGYAIFDNEKLIKLSHFSASGDCLSERLVDIRKKIIALIEEYEITDVAFEDIQLQDVKGNKEVGIKTFKILAQVFGVIQELLAELSINCFIVQPIVWKAHFKIAGKGRKQEKELSKQIINKMYNLNCTEDEADACCIAAYTIYQQREEYDWS